MRTFKPSFRYENPLKDRFGFPFFEALPKSPGVYFMKDKDGEILYVGKAKCLRSRIISYRNAKPGQVGDNIIELLERVVAIDWEEHESEARAFQRENELIHAITPPYNIADNWEEDYFFIGLRERAPGKLEFRLTSREEDEAEFELFGCFRHRRKVKSAYTALLRILYASATEKERFSFPSKITRSSPPYNYALPVRVPERWVPALKDLLRGKSEALLQKAVIHLLEKESLPAFVRPGLQEDIEIVRDFFRTCAKANLDCGKPGLRARIISHDEMRRQIRKTLRRDRPA